MGNFYLDYYIQNREAYIKVKNLAEKIEFSDRGYFIVNPLMLGDADYNIENGFMILTPGEKILLVNMNEEKFEEYKFNIKTSVIEHLMKHKFLSLFGSPYEFSQSNVYFEEILFEDLEKKIENNPKFEKIISTNHDIKTMKKNNVLISLLIGSINLSKPIVENFDSGDLLSEIKNKILLFDVDQTRFIFPNKPEHKESIGIHGMAGSGKTELLLHRMANEYSKSENIKIAFTCHNIMLSNKLRNEKIPQFFNMIKVDEQIEWEQKLWCFSSWGKRRDINSGYYSFICKKLGIPFYNLGEAGSFAKACKSAIDDINNIELEDERKVFDFTFIDEAQDLPPEFITLCKLVTRQKVYYAGDTFQDIFDVGSENLTNPDLVLSKVYRNDIRTTMFAQFNSLGYFDDLRSWLKDEELSMCGYSFERAEKFKIKSKLNNRFASIIDEKNIVPYRLYNVKQNEIVNKVTKNIEDIIKNHNSAEYGDIAIIILGQNYTKNVELSYDLRDKLSHIGVPASLGIENESPEKDMVYISNQNRVKGLEFSFVYTIIMPNIVYNLGMRNSLYMSLTRSIFETNIFYIDESEEQFDNIKFYANSIAEYCEFEIAEPTEDEKTKIIERSKIELARYISLDENIALIVSEIINNELPQHKESENTLISMIKNIPTINSKSDEEIRSAVRSIAETF